MDIHNTPLPGAYIISPQVWGDDRGYFHEVYHKDKFCEAGINVEFVQDNLSYSRKSILRGLHLQWNPHQGKLVRAVQGAIYDVIVDVRDGSDTFGQWFGAELNDQNHNMLWLPPGFAHGFVVLSEDAIVEYKCTGVYNGNCEASIRFDDPEIGIKWPIALDSVTISEKDTNGISLSEWKNSEEYRLFNDSLPIPQS